jgi:hypothetical protein
LLIPWRAWSGSDGASEAEDGKARGGQPSWWPPSAFGLLATEGYRPSRRSCPNGIRLAASRINIGPTMPAAPATTNSKIVGSVSSAPAPVTTPVTKIGWYR